MPTLIVKRLIKPGHEKEYERTLDTLIEESQKMEGYMGINVVKPVDKSYPLYVFIARFNTAENLNKFKNSEIRKTVLKHIKSFSQAPIKEHTVSKHDWWFALPGAHYDIPRYKMVLVTIFAAYPVVLAVNLYYTHGQNIQEVAYRTLIAVIITIAAISYLTMPLALTIFHTWLNDKK